MNATITKTSSPQASVEETKQNLRDVAEAAGGNARRFLQEKSEQAAELRKTAEDRITDHPLQSVAIAAVGGLLLGALLRR